MSKILFSPYSYLQATMLFSFYLNIDLMQKAVNDVIDIFTSEDKGNNLLVIFS